jgi:hypothetical protein
VQVRAVWLLVALSVVVAGSPPAPAAPEPTKWQRDQAERLKNSAPADEYFGRFKISFLEMNNTFRDAAISSGAHTTDPRIAHRIELAEEALEAWAKKYPRDPQLARTYFLAMNAERKIWIDRNQRRAWVYLNRLVELFPATYFGKLVKNDLARGFTEHYYASPEPCPVAVATATPSAEITDLTTPDPAAPSAAAADSPTPQPAATPTPEPTPIPQPSPTRGPVELQLAANHRAEILPQPCFVPKSSAAPSPSGGT